MKKHFVLAISLFLIALAAPALVQASAPASTCADTDSLCKDFEKDLEAGQPEKVIARYKPSESYPDQILSLVGRAYLAMASRENITPEQELGCYRKALEVKQYGAYMGLYFHYVQEDEEKALGFLREYVKTKPADTVPYVILGESELNKKHYELADVYLREGEKFAHAHSPRVDWMLFQANYLLGNYPFAGKMFESAAAQGNFENEIKAIAADPRFAGIDRRTEFKPYQAMLKASQASN